MHGLHRSATCASILSGIKEFSPKQERNCGTWREKSTCSIFSRSTQTYSHGSSPQPKRDLAVPNYIEGDAPCTD